MKLRTTPALALSLAVLLMAGCSSVRLPDPIGQNCACQSDKPVEVQIGANGLPTIDRPILLVPRGSTRPIVWTLPRDAGYTFPPDGRGIVIEGRIVDRIVYAPDPDRPRDRIKAVALDPNVPAFAEKCSLSDKGRTVTCPYKSAGPAVYKYTITVQRGDAPPVSLDPVIIEM